MDSNIYKDAYEIEEKQRAHLASTINIPIVASTAVGGALAADKARPPTRPHPRRVFSFR